MVTLNDYLYSGATVFRILKKYTQDLRASAKVSKNEVDLEQGREETRLSIARKLFEAGTPVDVIVNCTGVDDGTIASFAHPE